MAFVFVSVLLASWQTVILCSSVFATGLRYCTRPVAGQFQVPPGQRFTVAIYVCAFTCACSFTVHNVRGFLLIVLSFSVFFPLPPNPLLLVVVL